MRDTPPMPAAAPRLMRAVLYERYGPPDVLQFRHVPRPVPGGHDVLIRTHATTVSSGDWRMRSLEVPAGFGLILRLMAGVRRPRQPVLGTEVAGTVAAVGSGVRRFQVGDAVVAFSDMAMGCHAAKPLVRAGRGPELRRHHGAAFSAAGRAPAG